MGFQDYILLNPNPTENLSVEVEVGDLRGNSVAFPVIALRDTKLLEKFKL